MFFLWYFAIGALFACALSWALNSDFVDEDLSLEAQSIISLLKSEPHLRFIVLAICGLFWLPLIVQAIWERFHES